MTWYAIAINPSSTRQAKTAHYVRGPKNGLKIINVFSETLFEIEKALAEYGFLSFVPGDTLCVRDRQHGGYVLRRFPMLRGYAFVHNPHDWRALEGVKGVTGLLGSGRTPIKIQDADIALLRLAEDDCMERAKESKTRMDQKGKRVTRRMAGHVFPNGMQVEINHPTLGIQRATIEATTGRGTVKAMAQFLGGLVPVEVPMDTVREIAA